MGRKVQPKISSLTTTTSKQMPLKMLKHQKNNKTFVAIKSWQLFHISMLLTVIALFASNADCHHEISQISPKSSDHLGLVNIQPLLTTTSSDQVLSTSMNDISQTQAMVTSTKMFGDNETRSHTRIQRSALPIVNEKYPISGQNNVQFPIESEKEAVAGRYFQYNIKPTSSMEQESPKMESTKNGERSGKSVKVATPTAASTTGSFLVNGDLRQPMSGSQKASTNTSSATLTAATATVSPHNPRQNPNPDIQDIITGIVKLLNGNVNVHANTQGVRRPTASRINNRGPPRISDVQPLPIDYDNGHKTQGTSSMRPPPYPFDRPERPFITGVPIPEQIVPVRPGFVSNRPPWHRNKPRPPITTSIGGRRPIPQYKPLPPAQIQPPQEEDEGEELTASGIPSTQSTGTAGVPTVDSENNDAIEGPTPTDTSYDSEFSNEDLNTQYIEVSDNDTDIISANRDAIHEYKPPIPSPSSTTSTPAPVPVATHPTSQSKKDGENPPAKKKPSKHKNNDKKKHNNNADHIHSSSVEPLPVVQKTSQYLPMPMDTTENSGDEVIFMTASKTPELESVGAKHHKLKTSSSSPSSSSPSSSVSAIPSSSSSKIKSSAITTKPVSTEEQQLDKTSISLTSNFDLKTTIVPTPITSVPITTTTTTSTTTTTTSTSSTTSSTSTTTTTETIPTSNNQNQVTTPTPPVPAHYHPRPGIVLDDPEFQPGGRPRPQRPPQPQLPHNPVQPLNIQPTRHQLPPGYGEIFDVTLSAIQGPGSQGGSQQTINIKPFGTYDSGVGGAGADIIVSASGEDGFVSIDGKRTYINLFGDPTDPPTSVQQPSPATAIPQLPSSPLGPLAAPPSSSSSSSTSKPNPNGSSVSSGSGGNTPVTQKNTPSAGYGVAETEIVDIHTNKPQHVKPQQQSLPTTTNVGTTRPHYRPRTTQPPVRIDTCIVGDDTTCDQAQHEYCKTENGVSSCHCRPGYSRRKHREPCRRVITFYIGMRVDRIYEHRIVWDNKLADRTSEPYGQLSFESVRAIDSAMSMTPYSDEFMEAKVNNIYRDPNLGGSGVFVNLTIKLDESVETLRPNLRSDVQKHLLGVLHRRNNNIGNSVLFVSSPEGAISPLRDLDECQARDLNDCHPTATCTNTWGSYRCTCPEGTKDMWSDQPHRSGRECQTCPETYCNSRGVCSYNEEGNQICTCDGSHYGGQCEIDGEVLGVAIGASVLAVIIIVLTLVCLIMWSRRWQREQKNAIGSPVFGYMNTAPLKSAALPQPGYQVTLEDRMRWAQIADVMAQTNHYGAEPIGGPTRPSSAMFAYPNLQTLGMGTLGGMSMQSTMHQQMHHQQTNTLAPPVPLPRYERLGLSSRSNGMRTLDNSSSSEEEDRTDLLGRNFQVPRPKSRSNGSIANQSGIYYDVDYEPSANGIGSTSVDRLYGSQNQSTTHSHVGSSHIPGPQGIPMSTYTSGRAPSSYYMK
ncbi:mucin-2-like isoform X1 [Musca domestica]|uniref:Mucin-2-like isoform X1 n=1 Tax=Musca domestica TaxID=7370 RepID=A0A1I8N394_MUSDO|nr:mucin-2-like isoform X1 [Musca domestica]XP_058982090.1 mucin-2-like isoform X1 [Musca domestica]XP_058982095.1 mucin-2-like isoform X1 [Musca domestica]